MITFTAKIQRAEDRKVAGLVVPADVVASLGKGKRPAVKVTLNGYTYRSTIGVMGGVSMIPLNAENRRAADVEDVSSIEVALELDGESRAVAPPPDLKDALLRAKLLAAFEGSAPSHQKEMVLRIEEAKSAETRERRIAKAIDGLRAKAQTKAKR